ncbi:hypothetical protein [Clostridium ganghwense]|uniref:Uncharacterized protein n=1 Tax=Clostridium ganghwense TaxID=312089 RepID=A0ABT4CKA6_9CLOT|nr:hypothetical protein [Clostridium ganghwense]MCY6369480.1 hypothetical protein [Clostridium ganghwense]
MNKFKELINTQIALFSGLLSFEEYMKIMREKNMLLFQYILLLIFFSICTFIYDIEWYIIVWGVSVLTYGVLLVSKAENIKEHFIYSAIWAISSFIISVIILFIVVSFLE